MLLTSGLIPMFVSNVSAQIVITEFNIAVTENFDSLPSTGTTSGALPAGWSFAESGISADSLYGVSTGSAAGAGAYDYGSSGSSDRALGMQRQTGSNTAAEIFAQFQNATGAVIPAFEITYRSEQWRVGGLRELRQDFVQVHYRVNDGPWIYAGAGLAGRSSIVSWSLGPAASNGNSRFYNCSGSIAPNIGPGDTLWLRWSDVDSGAGLHDGLAVDNFSITAVPEIEEQVSLACGFLIVVGTLMRRARYRQGASGVIEDTAVKALV